MARVNELANRELKKQYSEREIFHCEAGLDGVCSGPVFLSWHHRHKRRWYRGKEHLLATYNHTILVCAACHGVLEQRPDLTEKIFREKRGEEIDYRICPACDETLGTNDDCFVCRDFAMDAKDYENEIRGDVL